ncbi:MAG: histidine phosphatase family protein [Desulfobulbaceae bacterium]|nr:MAG: histidine phosphatase family protein [Desulfobulbaceae bacterium]
MVTTFCLVRHGATEGSEVPRYKGSIDVALSAHGQAQMRQTAGRLRDYLAKLITARQHSYLRDIHGKSADDNRPDSTNKSNTDSGRDHEAEPVDDGRSETRVGLDVVYCSPLIRAVRSAEIIAAPYGLEPVETPDLRERHFGAWEGLSLTEIKQGYPDAFAAWAADPVRFAPPGGESTLELARRAEAAFNEILRRHFGQNLAVVAHGGINRVILCHLLGVPLENIFRLEQDLACFNIIEFWDLLPVVKLLNDA